MEASVSGSNSNKFLQLPEPHLAFRKGTTPPYPSGAGIEAFHSLPLSHLSEIDTMVGEREVPGSFQRGLTPL